MLKLSRHDGFTVEVRDFLDLQGAYNQVLVTFLVWVEKASHLQGRLKIGFFDQAAEGSFGP